MGTTSIRGGVGLSMATLAAMAVLATATAASADVSLAGRWQVDRQSQFGPFSTTMTFGQTGTTVTSAIGLSGTIDPVTGVFHLEGTHLCVDPVTLASGTAPVTMDGTVDPGGTSFTGTYLDAIQPTRSCLQISGPMLGTFLDAATCRNGIAEPGEECDSGACCDATCHALATGTSCAGPIPFCVQYVCSDTHQCVQDPAQPDRDHDGVPDVCDFCNTGDACFGTNFCLSYHCVPGDLLGGGQCQPDAVQPDADGDGTPDRCDSCATGDVCIGPDACLTYRCGTGVPQCAPDPPVDTDGDGVADACDACTGGAALHRSRLELIDLEGTSPPRLRARGELSLPATTLVGLDPVAHGLDVRVTAAGGGVLVDVTVAPGAGWVARRGGRGWTYRSASPTAPIGSVSLALPSSTPGTLRYRINGAPVAVPPGSVVLPPTLTVGLDPPHASTGVCGEQAYAGASACTLRSGGRRVSCRTP
jgi:hypothetical protein